MADGPAVDAARSHVKRLLLEDAEPLLRLSEVNMKLLLIAVIGTCLALATVNAEAKGCLKGAAVGGAAGHFAGHHGVLGAAAGCAIGRHQANKAANQQQNRQPQTTGSAPNK